MAKQKQAKPAGKAIASKAAKRPVAKASSNVRKPTKVAAAKSRAIKPKTAGMARAIAKPGNASSLKVSPPKLSPAKATPAAATANGTRRRQRVVVSHYREEDFVASALSYAKCRDIGIGAATGGTAQARVIRLTGPCDPEQVSKLHYHNADLNLVYVLNGWVKCFIEGQGEILMRQGSCWTQPARVKHLVRDYSDNCELLEVTVPAEFKTVYVKA
jgi:quercetin dioxygenase-like cupin family protein